MPCCAVAAVRSQSKTKTNFFVAGVDTQGEHRSTVSSLFQNEKGELRTSLESYIHPASSSSFFFFFSNSLLSNAFFSILDPYTGPGSFYNHWHNTFDLYLNEVVSPLFDPPLFFELVTLDIHDVAHAVAAGEVDFALLDPSVATCAVRESDGVANAILTVEENIHGKNEVADMIVPVGPVSQTHQTNWQEERRRLGTPLKLLSCAPTSPASLRDQAHTALSLKLALYTLPIFRIGHSLSETGGVIFTRADNADILTLADVKGKRVSCARPNKLNGFQAQLAEFEREGFHLLDHVGQLIFTSTYDAILDAVRTGASDVGFVDAGTIEEEVANGNIPEGLFRVLHIVDQPKDKDHPFVISTHTYPGWALVMHNTVEFELQRLVSQALLSISRNSTVAKLDSYTGWKPAANYLEIIDVLEIAGILEPGQHTCESTDDLANIITCPDQYVPKSADEIEKGCGRNGFYCPTSDANVTYTCLCHPCKRACGSNMEHNPDGSCSCLGGYVPVGDVCLEMTTLVVSIVLPLAILLATLGWYYARWQIRQADALWHIKPHQLKFDDPAVSLGAGSFGVVIKAEYRGSAVALKSLRPPDRRTLVAAAEGQSGSRSLRSFFGRSPYRSAVTLHKATRLGFAYSGFEHVPDEVARGKLQLSRALRQGMDAVQDAMPAASSAKKGANSG